MQSVYNRAVSEFDKAAVAAPLVASAESLVSLSKRSSSASIWDSAKK